VRVEARVHPGLYLACNSHKPIGRLPLISARPAVSFPTAEHHRSLVIITHAHGSRVSIALIRLSLSVCLSVCLYAR